jgi:predicted  nucleic acid-binding Zn-ribbon protein
LTVQRVQIFNLLKEYIMRMTLVCASFILASLLTAEEQITVSIFKMKDGRAIESVKFAAVGDEGAKIFMLKTTAGERVTVAEADVESRSEKRIPVSELPASAETQKADAPKATAATPDQSETKQNQKLTAVKKDIDARTALRQVEAELVQAKARLLPVQQSIADANKGIAAAQANSDTAAKELSGIPEAKKGNSSDAAARDLESKHEARRQTLRRRIKAAEDEIASLTSRKTEAEKQAVDINTQILKVTEKLQAAQKEVTAAAAEKSKAIVAANAPDQPLQKQPDEAGSIHILKLKDGRELRVKSIKKVDKGMILIVDENNQERRFNASDFENLE